MIVTDLEYGLETKLVLKLDAMIARCTQDNPKKDAVLINEGAEGEGKSSSSWAEAYYVKYKTGRDVHIFFRLEPMIEFAKSHKDKIIIWDEPSLDALSTDALTKLSKNMTRLLMTVRKNRHFFIFNLTKFWKFPEYLVVDRCLGFVHMYSRREVEAGRFVYIKKKRLEQLWKDYHTSKIRNYKKLKSFGGSFPMMEKFFDRMDFTVEGVAHAKLTDYEEQKDIAINSIGTKGVDKGIEDLKSLKNRIGKLKFPIKSQRDMALKLGVSASTITDWRYLDQKAQNLNSGMSENVVVRTNLLSNGAMVEKNKISPEEELDDILEE